MLINFYQGFIFYKGVCVYVCYMYVCKACLCMCLLVHTWRSECQVLCLSTLHRVVFIASNMIAHGNLAS